jgi:NAD(P)-dependent dehydrogenase (short-subunit alcohol dehydrogenase family)
MRLKNKVILVTGSTTGIGEGMARLFAREGASVMVHGINEEAAQQLVAEIQRAGGQASYLLGPLEEAGIAQSIIRGVVDFWGRIDGLVNNAANMARGSLESTDLAAFDRTISVNLRAPFLLIQAALPWFRRQGGGRILNIGSVNGYCGEKNQFAYSISKGGLMTLTRNVADAYGAEGIRANLLNVGWTLTPNEYELKKREGLPDDWPDHLPRTFAPSGRLLSPEDVAWAATYFMSDEASLVNGAIVDFEQYPLIGRNPPKETE